MTYVGDDTLLRNIGYAKFAKCWLRQLEMRDRDPSSYQVGDTLEGLKVSNVKRTWVKIVPAELKLRRLNDMRVGERFEEIVLRASSQVQAVFLDVGGTDDVAAFRRTGNLAKPVEAYQFSEVMQVEVVEVEKGRVYVKQLR